MDTMRGFTAANKDAVKALYDSIDKAGISEHTALDMVYLLWKANTFYNHINALKSEIKLANDIMKADSPNNAINTTFPAALLQRRMVDIAAKKLRLYGSSYRGLGNSTE